jgi:pimeloyl-ACP methyl ester carboxylesterase
MSITGTRLDVRGLRFNVLVEGEGPDVLLVHGFPDSNAVWRNQIPALVDAGFRVIAPDLRGFGESTAPRRRNDYQIDEFVEDLIAILDALDVPTVRLVGHDWGAAVGWQTCIRHADRIDRYAALAVGHPSAYAHGGLVQKLKAYYVLFFQIPGLSEKMVSAADWWLWRRMLRYDAEMPTWRQDLSRPGRLTAAINIYRANLGLILPKEHPKVTVPVMGVWGEGDVALVERQMVASRKYVTAPWRYERVRGGTHWLQLEAPDKTNSLLVDFLGEKHELGAEPSGAKSTRGASG